jgi:hypothetical protein
MLRSHLLYSALNAPSARLRRNNSKLPVSHTVSRPPVQVWTAYGPRFKEGLASPHALLCNCRRIWWRIDRCIACLFFRPFPWLYTVARAPLHPPSTCCILCSARPRKARSPNSSSRNALASCGKHKRHSTGAAYCGRTTTSSGLRIDGGLVTAPSCTGDITKCCETAKS